MKILWITGGVLALCLAGTSSVHAVMRSDNLVVASKSVKRGPASQRAAAERAAAERLGHPADVVVVTQTGPGQAGYVHYFIITGPDGEPESHVGVELPGNRIAWSFPEVGVTIVPFMKSGVLSPGGKRYEIEHLYGLRPPGDEESVRALQRSVAERVAWWVDEKIPFCDEARPYNRLCVSCLGFVLRVLYPGPSPALPTLPADFRSVRKSIYTTEDLLLYLAGVHLDVPRDARRKRIAALDVPDTLREQLTRIAVDEAAESATTAAAAKPRPAVARPRATGRSMVNSPRRLATKRGS